MDNIKIKKKNINKFINKWKNIGYEKGDNNSFWIELLEQVIGVNDATNFIQFEKKVKVNNISFIDAYIPLTKVLIEQKSIDIDLSSKIKQSDGTYLTPFEQAKRYSDQLPYSEKPRWIIACNFKEFYIYDMENVNLDPIVFDLDSLKDDCYKLDFLIDKDKEEIVKETNISLGACKIVREIYDCLLDQYKDDCSPDLKLKSANQIIVRLVFLLYCEDAGIFEKNLFYNYVKKSDSYHFRGDLINLFKVLDSRNEDRDPYLPDILNKFPYVNGGMFSKIDIEIPQFSDKLLDLIMYDASAGFNWSRISPTIFGAAFESTLAPNYRKNFGMHYTSIYNIHKVIDPLFLNNLKDELKSIKKMVYLKTKKNHAINFQNKLSKLNFLDPAAGSGNFLTETYISIRKLENEAIKIIYSDPLLDIGKNNIVKVSINQFYGMEFNDFAVSVAKTALWIAESQMLEETKSIFYSNDNFLPLKSYDNMIECNSLTTNWNDIISKNNLDYIFGNPPFVSAKNRTPSQKNDMKQVFSSKNGLGNLDYVASWYKKASDYMKGTSISAAFVSTDSISQGSQVNLLWPNLIKNGIKINFAYKTFPWKNESDSVASVMCIIIGFSYANIKHKKIFDIDGYTEVKNISPYIDSEPFAFFKNRSNPLFEYLPKIFLGSMANDDHGKLSKYSDDEYKKIVRKYPKAKNLFRRLVSSKELQDGTIRYCLWLVDVDPSYWKSIPPIVNAVNEVRNKRLSSSRKDTRKQALQPYLFGEIRQPMNEYISIPKTFKIREYLIIDVLDKNVISNDGTFIIDHFDPIIFSILTSKVHYTWAKRLSGKPGMGDLRYSKGTVYNNFPFPVMNNKMRNLLSESTSNILDLRRKYNSSSLLDLYDFNSMPIDLRKAHLHNDKIVMEAYKMNIKNYSDESYIFKYLVDMYNKHLKK